MHNKGSIAQNIDYFLETKGLSQLQRGNASIITELVLANPVLREKGIEASVALAMIANAQAESALGVHNASKLPEDSVGLFQLLREGAGTWLAPLPPRLPNGDPDPRDPRLDPVKNTKVMIDHEVMRSTRFQGLAQASGTTSLVDLAAFFGEKLERHAPAHNASRRKGYEQFFGALAYRSPAEINELFGKTYTEANKEQKKVIKFKKKSRMTFANVVILLFVLMAAIGVFMWWKDRKEVPFGSLIARD